MAVAVAVQVRWSQVGRLGGAGRGAVLLRHLINAMIAIDFFMKCL